MILIGILAGFLTVFLNYCIGKPGGEFSPYEIFSSYTVWLSKRRLKALDLLKTYEKQYNENLTRTEKKHEVITLKNDFDKIFYNTAEPFFTWERMIGMCPVCTGFWISGIVGLCFAKNLITLGAVILISHVTIRIFNKFI